MRDQFSGGGVGFVANINGRRSHDIVEKGIQVLINLTHRGASGPDPETGDGAGVLIQIPHQFFAREARSLGFSLPEPGEYGVGMMFLPVERQQRFQTEGTIERIVREEGLVMLGWRDTPVDASSIGRIARGSQPYIQQIFVGRAPGMNTDQLERRLYIVRKRAETELANSDLPEKGTLYVPSLSARTIVYKGLLLASQLAKFYLELSEPDLTSAMCLVYQSFGGLPHWDHAQPCRYVCHNGGFTAVRGNVNWIHARQPLMSSALFGDDIRKLFPVVEPGGSDSICFDNVIELLTQSGRSLPHAVTMLIPEAWDLNRHLSQSNRAFYEYHSAPMEPWDGPAAVAFTDGRVIGATLDRNGLRPVRYLVTNDGLVVLSSEAGVLPARPEDVRQKGRLQPGEMFLIDLEAGRIVSDEEVKQQLASRQPYREWLHANQLTLDQLPEPVRVHRSDYETILARQRAFGYTDEDLRTLIAPMAESAEEPIGSMGLDTPLACLSDQPQPLFNYFKQLFAQLTNPPIDPTREEMVMSLVSYLGAERNLLEETPGHCHVIKLSQPVITNRNLEKLRRVSRGDFLGSTIPTLYPVAEGVRGLERNLQALCRRASLAIQAGYTILVLSDRGIDEEYVAIPSLLAMTAVHNHLIREGTRTQVAIIIESGEPREVMHFAILIGYDACAVNPYLAIETIENMALCGTLPEGLNFDQAVGNYVRAINKGLLRVFSKAGISTLQSYRGAQAFEAIGLNSALVDQYFTGTPSRIEGIGLDVLARDVSVRHAQAFRPARDYEPELPAGGLYAWRVPGEYHSLNPLTISTLQRAVRGGNFQTFQEFTDSVDEQNKRLWTIRGLLQFRSGSPVRLEEIEPALEIVKRFETAAISFGSVSREAHDTLAIAMNRIGARSNSGEGGEEEFRFVPQPDRDLPAAP